MGFWGSGAVRILSQPEPSPRLFIATAGAVRTLGVGHAPSHRVDNQTGRVACESDF